MASQGVVNLDLNSRFCFSNSCLKIHLNFTTSFTVKENIETSINLQSNSMLCVKFPICAEPSFVYTRCLLWPNRATEFHDIKKFYYITSCESLAHCGQEINV